MARDKQVRCMCNSTYCGEICPHCGMPGATARFFFSANGKTGVGFVLIFFACVAFCFGYYYLDVKAPFTFSSETEAPLGGSSSRLLLDIVPDWDSGSEPVADPRPETEEEQDKKTVDSDSRPAVDTTPQEPAVDTTPQEPATDTSTDRDTQRTTPVNPEPTITDQQQKKNGTESGNSGRNRKTRRLETRTRAVPIGSKKKGKNTANADREQSQPGTKRGLSTLSAADAEKLVEPMLRILVGTQDAEQLIDKHFNEKVVETESNIQFERDELRERFEEYNAKYPVRVIKIISAGISGLRMELNTVRLFQNAAGERAISYGQTQVLIGQGGIIEGITDSTGKAEFPLSPKFIPINYKGEKLISNKTQ